MFDQFTAHHENATLGRLDMDLLAVLAAGAQEVDQASRASLYEEANRIVAERALMVPFVHAKTALVYSRRVTGYRPSPIFWEELFNVRLG